MHNNRCPWKITCCVVVCRMLYKCKHACAVIRFIGQNVVNFVDDRFKLPSQLLIYLGSFRGI